jgi:TRAP-type C4-dicarboxylate transport system substrate-binding protein
MSRKKFDGLPPAAREAIEKNSGDSFVLELAKHFVAQAGTGKENTEKHSAGHKILKPSPEKLAQWEKSLGKPVIDDWLATTPNGDKVLAKFNELYAQVKAGK